MKKYYKLIGSGLVAIAMVFLVAGTANAMGVFESGDNVGVNANETVNSTLFIAGNNVNVAGTINGDVFCAGQNVTVTGTVRGDVICAGQNLRINGTVTGDVRLAGQTVTLEANVEGNATVAAGVFTADTASLVGGDMTVFGESATLSGGVGRDLLVNGEDVAVNGQVGRDLNGEVERLALTDEAKVGGSVIYTSSRDLAQAEGATIGGEVERSKPAPVSHDSDGWQSFAPLASGLWLYFVVSLLLVSLAIVLIAPRHVHATSEYVMTRPGRTILVGFLASILVPIILIALLLTIFGIPLALLVLLGWLLVQFLAGPFMGYVAGRLILRSEDTSPILTMLLGGLVVILLYLIPIIGFLTLLAVMWFGTGALLSYAYDGHWTKTGATGAKKPRRKKA